MRDVLWEKFYILIICGKVFKYNDMKYKVNFIVIECFWRLGIGGVFLESVVRGLVVLL